MWKGFLRTAVLLQHSQNFEIGPWTNSSLLISIRLEVIGDLIRRLKSAGADCLVAYKQTKWGRQGQQHVQAGARGR
jgi:hypothetical protein